MCGINAIYAFHPSAPTVSLDELTMCREAMHSRGPDAAGLWTSNDLRVGLGHRRLSIIDVSERANQPMPKKTRPQSAKKCPTSSAGRSRKSAA